MNFIITLLRNTLLIKWITQDLYRIYRIWKFPLVIKRISNNHEVLMVFIYFNIVIKQHNKIKFELDSPKIQGEPSIRDATDWNADITPVRLLLGASRIAKCYNVSWNRLKFLFIFCKRAKNYKNLKVGAWDRTLYNPTFLGLQTPHPFSKWHYQTCKI